MHRPRGEEGGNDAPVVVARSLRLRGSTGRLTGTLVPSGIDQFGGRDWVLIGGAFGPYRRHEVESCETYGQKVVLKLRGIDSATDAEPFVGLDILLPCKGLVDLPEGTYYIFELVGLRVFTREGREIGTVRDVFETGGTPLLAIGAAGTERGGRQREEILLPAARSICRVIDTASGRITIDPPEGLLELYGI